MDPLTCRNCNREHAATDKTCAHCGFPLPRRQNIEQTQTAAESDRDAVTSEVSETGDPFASNDTSASIVTSEGRTIELRVGDRLIIGRSPDSPLAPICGDNISREHAEIFIDDEGDVYVVDTKSMNGTFVDGARLSACVPCRVVATAQVRLGAAPPLDLRIDVRERR